ncbi:MAG TPA: outer membrane protein transport protein [Byssovorax sp.]
MIPRKTGPRERAAAAIALASIALTCASTASAGGLYFADRGVRPLGRGGAFIAGADDLGAIAYNPAGLYDAGSGILFDASYLHFSLDYTRQAELRQVDPNTGKTVATYNETFPKTSGSAPFLPIPTLVGAFQPHKQWVIAFGAWVPYAGLTSFPETVNGKPGPQRYSLVTLDGSVLAFVGAGAAFAPSKEWRIGLTAGALVGTFKSQVTFSGCLPDRFFCAPEDPNWDVGGQLSVGPIVAPTGQIGVQFIPKPAWHFGAAFQLPVYIRSSATISTRLPSTPVFDRASQDGDSADVAFDLPWTLHVGIENRSVKNLRVEVGGGLEHWSMHDAITVTPTHVALDDVVGFPKHYVVPPITLERHFQDSFSVRAGGEYTLQAGGFAWDARAGLAFESSAIPNAYTSALTFDSNKITPSLGVSMHATKKLRLDLVYAHVFAFDVDVAPQDAKIPVVVPVLANPSSSPDTVNGGHYSGAADIIGLGFTYQFEPPAPEFVNSGEASATPPAAPPASAPKPDADKPAEPAPEPG